VGCEACGGKRFNAGTLEIRYQGKSIAEVLQLSVAEGIEFFAHQTRLRRPLEALRDTGLEYLQLGQISQTLSGGEAQRLKLALAFAETPPGALVVLDEPTAGLDPLSRRHVWNALRRTVAAARRTLLLTTHSLEEAEALCHRLGIVVDGELRCLGTPLRLKSKFGRGDERTLMPT
jgi:excinuclease ABC subunit A